MRKRLILGAIALGVVIGACAPVPSSGTGTVTDGADVGASEGVVNPPSPNPIAQVGEANNTDGVIITAEPLASQKDALKNKLMCTRVTYENTTDADVEYNLLYWHIEWPDNTRDNASPFGQDLLTSGTLEHSKKVVGNVCFPDKGQKGETAIVMDPWLGGDEPLKWYQIL